MKTVDLHWNRDADNHLFTMQWKQTKPFFFTHLRGNILDQLVQKPKGKITTEITFSLNSKKVSSAATCGHWVYAHCVFSVWGAVTLINGVALWAAALRGSIPPGCQCSLLSAIIYQRRRGAEGWALPVHLYSVPVESSSTVPRTHTYSSPTAQHKMLLHAYSCMSHFNRHHRQHHISIKHLSRCLMETLQVNHRSANRTKATVALPWHQLRCPPKAAI